MSSNSSDISDLQLIKCLISLNGLSIAKAAKAMNIQRSNLSVWLNGKANVFSVAKIEGMLEALGISAMSDASTGIRLRTLSPKVIHRWQVEEGAQSLIDVLRATESESSLERLEIFQVNINQQECFNILRNNAGENRGWIMLIANRDATSRDYPVSPETLGFGKAVGAIWIPILKWLAWWKEKSLPTPAFGEEISGFLRKVEAKQQNISHPQGSPETQLKNCQNQIEELKATIQSLADELRKVDPSNPMLNQI